MMQRIIPLAVASWLMVFPAWLRAADGPPSVADTPPGDEAGEEEDPTTWQPQTRLRPIDELGQADERGQVNRSGESRSGTQETSARVSVPVRQATYMQQPSDASQITAPALPPSPAEDSGGFSSPPATQPPGSYSDSGVIGSGAAPSAPTYSGGGGAPIYSDGGSAPPASGWQPAAPAASAPGWSGTQPATGSFATVDNNPCVTGPAQQTQYTVFGPQDCDTGAPMGVAPPAAITPSMAPVAVAGTAGRRPLINLSRQNYPVEVGQGIIGQPVAYVPGQPIRNFFRYIFP